MRLIIHSMFLVQLNNSITTFALVGDMILYDEYYRGNVLKSRAISILENQQKNPTCKFNYS